MSDRSVLIVDQSLQSSGVLANSAFVLGLTAGRELPPATFGTDTVDGNASLHKYLTNIPHIVRRAGQSKLRRLREVFAAHPQVLVIDYPEEAATSDYGQYRQQIGIGREIRYRAIYVYGPEELITAHTRNLSRLP